MKIGDLVIRKINVVPEGVNGHSLQNRIDEARLTSADLGHGIVLSKQIAGNPKHSCISVYYPKLGKIYDIAESLMEVISESR